MQYDAGFLWQGNWGLNRAYGLPEVLPRFVKRLLGCWDKKLMNASVPHKRNHFATFYLHSRLLLCYSPNFSCTFY